MNHRSSISNLQPQSSSLSSSSSFATSTIDNMDYYDDDDLDKMTKHFTKLCYVSSLSYLPIETIPQSDYYKEHVPSLRPIIQVVEPTTESGATIFVDESENDSTSIIVACRGSATIHNFATNLQFQLVPMSDNIWSNGDDLMRRPKVHEGFQLASIGLWEQLEPILTDIMKNNKKQYNEIIFTGHSLGGGTAELCALQYAVNAVDGGGGGPASASATTGLEENMEVVTFAGPMIGDSNFASYMNEKVSTLSSLLLSPNSNNDIYHVVHDKDPILSNNGPLWKQLGFVRSGVEISCDPYQPRLLFMTTTSSDSNDPTNDVGSRSKGFTIPPWNIVDHCKYLGLYVGPRL